MVCFLTVPPWLSSWSPLRFQASAEAGHAARVADPDGFPAGSDLREKKPGSDRKNQDPYLTLKNLSGPNKIPLTFFSSHNRRKTNRFINTLINT